MSKINHDDDDEMITVLLLYKQKRAGTADKLVAMMNTVE